MSINPSPKPIRNPFRPGAGHMPPYLAGREAETTEFRKLLQQDIILDNMILTGLRGVGKTVLLETFKPIAVQERWAWVGTDVSETATVTEENLAVRILTDLAVIFSTYVVSTRNIPKLGFTGDHEEEQITLNYETLLAIFDSTPGLVSDKLKATLVFIWACLEGNINGVVFAYDEAQNLSDQDGREQYPLSMLLDVFQSIQRANIPFMLVLTGLPTLFPKLVEARTFAERMFHVVFLDRLAAGDSRDAILKPIEDMDCPIILNEESVNRIIAISGGYPYFIQFICREVFDALIQRVNDGLDLKIPIEEIVRKLDNDFFAGRWAKATDRQRELLSLVAQLDSSNPEFTVQEIVDQSKKSRQKPFSNSHVHQMLTALANAGLVYKNRFGRYSFAVPLLADFIRRQNERTPVLPLEARP
jgi:hypothetical protein